MTLKEAAITLAIVVIFTTLVMVTIEAFYERPKMENYCNDSYYDRPMKYPDPSIFNCTENFMVEENNCYADKGMPTYTYDENGCRVFDTCSDCNIRFEDATKKYTNNMFLILAAIGIIAIFFGVYYKIEFLGSGFMFSGIVLLFIGTVQNFDVLNKYTRILVLTLELGLVIFIAYKKILNVKSIRKK
ncbi:MAG: hypothetical protein NDI94_00540 [Candidatus Woesearchaeota archaeon]|nr:hypothetical protein [Candidatus Woesearchaeota archaeon]